MYSILFIYIFYIIYLFMYSLYKIMRLCDNKKTKKFLFTKNGTEWNWTKCETVNERQITRK